MTKKIGFFGGTFDPIHLGHINLAIQIQEIAMLDEILICPNFLSPHKTHQQPLASAEDRYNMCALAVKEIPSFSLIDWEIKEQKAHYTIDTLRLLKKKFNDAELRLILSIEDLFHFKEWKEYEEIIAIAPPLIGHRSGFFNKMIHALSKDLKTKFKNSFVKTKAMEITSTEIRERIENNKYCGHLLPKEVLSYIIQKQLYGCKK
jgi:nicotinate-nucleotide adenylyltransferase